uniref:glycosyltransferase family 4 protein n=1 Tax=Dyella soli TaxID=522319 RepID=UPI0013F3F889|nr:glycosyltransferase family 1 protein [Dyella soli]
MSLNKIDNVDVTGLINHPNRRLWPGLKKGWFAKELTTARRMQRLSRFAISVKVDPLDFWWEKAVHFAWKRVDTWRQSAAANFGRDIPLYDFDARDFGDFIWQSAFSKTLPPSEMGTITNAKYATVKPSWDTLNRVAIAKAQNPLTRMPRLNTKGYDVFVSQTPCPANVAPSTQLVVRYHDAIPVFLPHTISSASLHQAAHMAGLAVNHKHALFACTSGATRDDLLKIHPELEKRAVIIPDIVSHEYREETTSHSYISNIIRNHISEETEPKFLTSREKENFYQKNLMSKPSRFLLMVSTLEPRKNHAKLIGAWDYLKNHGMPDLKLVLVASRGWEYSKILESMAPWQQRGELFHLERVPASQLRLLYRAAEAVVCPSVAEGFDLSGIEAMLCGGAVVASDIPVHREIYGKGCEYFNPYSAFEQAMAIQRVIEPANRVRRDELVAEGLLHSPRYRRENIEPYWQEFFERVKKGAFKSANLTAATGDLGWTGA